MFESGVELRGGGSRRRGSTELVDLLSPGDDVLLIQVAAHARDENRSAARKVLAAGALWESWIERDTELGSGRIVDCGNAAIAELAVRLGCSKTVAQSYAEIGCDLQLRLPKTRASFAAGDLDLARVRAICRETVGLAPTTVAALEPGIVAAARQLPPGPLAAEIERLIQRYSPDEAAEQRETVQAWQRRIVTRRGRGCASVEVTVSPDEGEAMMQLIAEFTRTVCARDHRGAQEKSVDALMGLVHGEPYLQCRCDRDDCAAEGSAALPGRRTPLTQITIDVQTLLGLASEPAYLHGHGLIDPELGRRLAGSGTWQAMLVELVDLASELGLKDVADRSSQHLNVRSFLARGTRRTAAPLIDPVTPPASVGTLAESILAAVQSDPALVNGTHRDGHGGLSAPPPGALTYRPDASTAALVRARDRHCRFPGCHRPAAQCQLDHIVEYSARNPVVGGWPIVSNLQCLCAFHHQLKTLGHWRAVTLGGPGVGGHALLWTSTLGSTRVTLPGGAVGAADLAPPRPRVVGGRGTCNTLAPDDGEPPPF
ncbi:HNH endonuclease signature motif containing protein [Rhodococcus gannanensis]|uniref:DUF222 domain-containing protein n=1 Tax=Rhodococcus gannanensis TaxID=1960308 RepID=A0ABW4P6U7_9NOCA